MFDYETLRFIWWLLIGVILVVFMISDGFDMGIGCLLPLVARNDDERRIVINSVGAHWEGNQVWLILAGGALFAAWPRVYAAAFSGFYVAMILVLCSLFFRPLAFDYRGKIADARWRKMWDAGLVIGSLVPPVVFGIAFGNCKAGVILQIIGNATACLPGQLPGPRNRTQQSNSHRTLYGIERIVPDQRGIAVLIHSYKIRVQFDR